MKRTKSRATSILRFICLRCPGGNRIPFGRSNTVYATATNQEMCTASSWKDKTFCKEKLGLDKPLGKIDRKKLNIHGSSLAAGHPFAATGGRIVATLAKMLAHKGAGRGLISICAAGGQGVVAIIDR